MSDNKKVEDVNPPKKKRGQRGKTAKPKSPPIDPNAPKKTKGNQKGNTLGGGRPEGSINMKYPVRAAIIRKFGSIDQMIDKMMHVMEFGEASDQMQNFWKLLAWVAKPEVDTNIEDRTVIIQDNLPEFSELAKLHGAGIEKAAAIAAQEAEDQKLKDKEEDEKDKSGLQ